MVFIQNTYFDGVYDDIVTPLADTATGILSTDGTSATPTYSVPGSTLVSSPVVTTSTPTPPALVSVSHAIAETTPDYLAALAGTARDVTETIISTIMTGVHLIRDLIVLQITALRGYFDQIWTRETHTETLCVGTNGNETCITKEQLDALLLMVATASGTTATSVTSTTTNSTTVATTPTTTNETALIETTVVPAIELTASGTITAESIITTPSPSVEIIPVIKEETPAPVVEVIPTTEEIPMVTETLVITTP